MAKRRQGKRNGKKKKRKSGAGSECARNRKLRRMIFDMGLEDVQKEEDLDTIQILNDILNQPQVSMLQLRNVAAFRGLVHNRIRARVWPLLLGVDIDEFDWGRYDELSKMDHKDTPIVQADIPRSMNQFTVGFSPEQKEEKRAELRRLLNAVVNVHEGDVHYYQGLHDIGAALILTLGERLAYPILCNLARCHLRDCTRQSLDAVTELLTLINPILEMADYDIAKILETMGVPCFFSLSWFITWFSHDVHNLPDVARLFDLFVSSHPMMPLYVGAAGISAAREDLICITDMCEMHSALVNLKISKYISTDDLIRKAINLFSKASPKRMIRRARLKREHATSPDAYLEEDHWVVPDKPDRWNPLLSGDPIWWSLRTLAGSIVASGQKSRPITTLSMVGMGVIAVLVTIKIMDSQMLHIQDQAWDSMIGPEL